MLNPLQAAILDGDRREVIRLAAEMPDLLKTTTETGTSILSLAQKKGLLEVFVPLIRMGAPGSESIANWGELLEKYISELSDFRACAGWFINIEYLLWDGMESAEELQEFDKVDFCDFTSLTAETKKDLAFLAERSKGWPMWSDAERRVVHVELQTWRSKYGVWKKLGEQGL